MPRDPRILFVDQSGHLGGAELYLLDLARAFAPDCRVVIFEDGPFAEALRDEDLPLCVLRPDGAVNQVRKQDGLWAALRSVPGFIRLARRLSRLARDYDVIFANTQKAMVVAGLAGHIARKPVVWNLHDLLTDDHFTTLNRTVAVHSANLFADRVVANSEASLHAFKQAGGRVPTSVVYNGIDPTPFRELSSDARTDLRADLGIGDVPLIGVFSRLAEWKGQHVLVDALSDLSDPHVILVGDALFDGDEAYVDALKRRIDDSGLTDRIHFLGFRSDVPALMNACDIIAHTSVAPEPFGRVIVEGMLARRPVVATRAGGALEIIQDGKTGRLVPPNDAQALAEALSSLLDAPETAHRMAQEGFEFARTHFSIEGMESGIRRATTSVSDHHEMSALQQ